VPGENGVEGREDDARGRNEGADLRHDRNYRVLTRKRPSENMIFHLIHSKEENILFIYEKVKALWEKKRQEKTKSEETRRVGLESDSNTQQGDNKKIKM
jgi:hypothetical protein